MANENTVVSMTLAARDEASAAVRRLAGELGQMPGVLSRIGAAGGVIGGIVAGIISAAGAAGVITKTFGDQAVTLDRLARSVGTTAENVQVLRQTYKGLGLEADQADTALQFMSKAISLHHDKLAELGVTSRDAYTATLQLSKALGEHKDAAYRNAELSQLLGRQWRSLSGVVADLGDATDETRKKMEAAGALMDDQMIAKGKEIHKTFEDLGIRWRGIWLDMAKDLEPPVRGMIKLLDAYLEKLHQMDEFMHPTGGGTVPHMAGAMGAQAARDAQNTLADLTDKLKQRAVAGELAAEAARRQAEQEENLDEATKKHAEELRKLMDVYPGVTKRMAETILKSKDLNEEQAKLRELVKLFPDLLTGVKEPIEGLGGIETEQQRQQRIDDMNRYAASFRALNITAREAFADVVGGFRQSVADQLTATAVLQNALQSVYQNLQQASATMFADILAGAHKFGHDLIGIFAAIGQAFEQMIAQLVATELFKVFLKILGAIVGFAFGGPVGAAGGEEAAGFAGPPISLVPAGQPIPHRSGPAGLNVTNIYNYTSLAPNTVLGEMLHPSGALRRANLRAAEVSAA